MKDQETFKYVYSANQQAEIEKIRNKYAPAKRGEDKLEELKSLDRRVTKRAAAISAASAVAGLLILGLGMSLIMTDIGKALGSAGSMALGIAAGLIGLSLVCLAHPIHSLVLDRQRKKIADKVVSLADELLK